jgi:hypothetical protein
MFGQSCVEPPPGAVRVPGLAGVVGEALGVGVGSAANAVVYAAATPPSVSAAISTAFAMFAPFGMFAASIRDHLQLLRCIEHPRRA